MNYRREIDGLRALALLTVILFHAGFETFKGGFVGVDVFFVISGYLITTIILAELESDKFSIINFYERRARRILPVLFLIMALSIPFAWIILYPFDLTSFSRSLVASALFFSNLFFWKDGGYFETAAELKPLLHTWSLAVEIQYYVFFPIFFILFWKLGKKWLTFLIILITFTSLIMAQFGSSYKPVANFFLLPTRIWEFGIGALISLYNSQENKIDLSSSMRQILSALGFFLITISIFLFNQDTPFPSIYALMPTLGTASILLFARFDTIIGKILSSRLLVFIGMISYSAYLWHQPILAFSRYYFSSIGLTQISALIIVTLLLSTLSWKYIECPFRNKNIITRKFFISFILILSLFFIVFGNLSAKLFESSSHFRIEEKIAKALSNSVAVYSTNMDDRKFVKYRIQFEKPSPKVITLGSSRIMQIGDSSYGDKILNLGVSGASMEDIIAIASMAIKKFNPSSLFIGLDPWLFNSKSEQDRWKSLSEEYFSALSDLQINPPSIKIYQNEIKDTMFSKFGARLYNSIHNQNLGARNDFPELRDKVRKDGSRVYNKIHIKKTQEEIHKGFDNLLNYAMNEYKYSKESQAIFEKFIEAYSNNHNIIFILSPYHPVLYKRMRRERPIYLEIENHFRDLAKSLGIQIIGSYDPNKVDCNPSDFYDGMHPKDVCIEKILKELNKN